MRFGASSSPSSFPLPFPYSLILPPLFFLSMLPLPLHRTSTSSSSSEGAAGLVGLVDCKAFSLFPPSSSHVLWAGASNISSTSWASPSTSSPFLLIGHPIAAAAVWGQWHQVQQQQLSWTFIGVLEEFQNWGLLGLFLHALLVKKGAWGVCNFT